MAYVPGGWGANWRVYAQDLFGTVPSRGEGGSLSTGLSGAVRNVCHCLTIGMVCVRVLLTVSHICGVECISWVGLLGGAVMEALLVEGGDPPIPAAKVEKDGCLGGDRDRYSVFFVVYTVYNKQPFICNPLCTCTCPCSH